jgi:hypothetical protein
MRRTPTLGALLPAATTLRGAPLRPSAPARVAGRRPPPPAAAAAAAAAGATAAAGARAPAPAAAAPAAAAPEHLYEPRYGLPVVRRRLGYSDLLRAIRRGEVEELLFFSQRGRPDLEGPCLVALADGTTAQASVPPHDVRIPYAMEAHGVRGRRLAPAPSAAQLAPPRALAPAVASFLTDVLPYLAVAAVYAATSIVRRRKGDAEDREKIKAREAVERARRAAEERADRFLADAEVLAGQGWAADAILEKAARAGTTASREAVEEVVARVRASDAAALRSAAGAGNSAEAAAAQLADEEAFRVKMREAAAETDPTAQAEEFRKMKTVRVQKAQ